MFRISNRKNSIDVDYNLKNGEPSGVYRYRPGRGTFRQLFGLAKAADKIKFDFKQLSEEFVLDKKCFLDHYEGRRDDNSSFPGEFWYWIKSKILVIYS